VVTFYYEINLSATKEEKQTIKVKKKYKQSGNI